MNKELQDMLCSYLGELMYQSDNEFDWIEKEQLLQKIDAVNLLLGVRAKEKRLSYMEKLMDAVKNIHP